MNRVRRPIIRWFFQSGDVISGGNFHGAPLALALDYAAIALTDLMSISERRIERLMNPDMNEGLPAFLARRPGMESGFMIAHVSAVALLNEAKVRAHPSSIDNVPTSGGKEDHVSMGNDGAEIPSDYRSRGKLAGDRTARGCEGLSSGVRSKVALARAYAAPLSGKSRALIAGPSVVRWILRAAEAIFAGRFRYRLRRIMSGNESSHAPRGNERACKAGIRSGHADAHEHLIQTWPKIRIGLLFTAEQVAPQEVGKRSTRLSGLCASLKMTRRSLCNQENRSGNSGHTMKRRAF